MKSNKKLTDIRITYMDGESSDADDWNLVGEDQESIDDGEIVMHETDREYVFRDKKTSLVLARYVKKFVIKIQYQYE